MAVWLRGRVAEWPKLISAEMSTIVYDSGRSREIFPCNLATISIFFLNMASGGLYYLYLSIMVYIY